MVKGTDGEETMIPQCSVVIPLYNKEKYIVRTIRSVLDQSITDFELIIVDDGSTDNSLKEAASIQDPRIRIIHQPNRGASSARNAGVAVSTTDFIAFIDADDEWLPWHLSSLLILQRKYPTAGIVTDMYAIKTKEGVTRMANYQAVPDQSYDCIIPNFFESVVKGDFPLNASSFGIRKKVYLKCGGFPEGNRWGEEMDLFGRIAFNYPIAFSWSCGSVYHWDVEGRVCSLPSTEREPFVKTALAELSQVNGARRFEPYITECINKKELYRAACLIYCGDPVQARAVATKCMTDFFTKEKWVILSLTYLPLGIVQKIVKRILRFD